MQAESRERNAVVAQSDSYRSVWARDNAHYTPLEGPATVRDLPPNPLTDVEQHSGLQKVHIGHHLNRPGFDGGCGGVKLPHCGSVTSTSWPDPCGALGV